MPKSTPKNDNQRLNSAKKALSTQQNNRNRFKSEGWIQAKEFKYTFKSINRKARCKNIPRTASPKDVFQKIFPNSVIMSLIKFNNDNWKEENLHLKPITTNEMYNFLKMRVRILSQKKEKMLDYWIGGHQHIGRDRYQEIANNLSVDVKALAADLTHTWRQLWIHGRYCTLDEDLEKHKRSPWRIKIDGKPGSPGHLMLMVSSRSEVHDKPFATSVLPHCSDKRSNTAESIQFAVDDIKVVTRDEKKMPPPTLVLDSWFLSEESKKVLDTNSTQYLAALHSNRFKYLHEELSNNTWKEAEWNTISNPNGEFCTFFVQGGKKKYVMTNAFKKGGKLASIPPVAPFTVEYRAWFNAVDRINATIGEIKYPHKQNPNPAFKFFDQLFRVGLNNIWVAFYDNRQEHAIPTLDNFLKTLDSDF